MRAHVLCLVLVTGCGGPADTTVDAGWIAPFDGQTAFHADQDLVLSMQGITIPEDYPLPSLIRVMDMLSGGEVQGTVTLTEDELRFTPDSPWATDRRCGWTVYDPYEIAHGPEVHLPDGTSGTAVFEVSDNLHALDATVGEQAGEVCLLLSRPADGPLLVRTWVEDRESVTLVNDPVFIDADYPLLETDSGPGARCFVMSESVAAGDAIRVQLDGGGGLVAPAGPWRLELSDQPLAELLATRRRAVLSPSEWAGVQ